MLLATVGGGTSGAVLASRLAEDKKSILVIEAGRDPSGVQAIDIPLMADSVRGTEFDWQYRTVPQKSACLGHVEKVRCLSHICSDDLAAQPHRFTRGPCFALSRSLQGPKTSL